MKPHRSFALLLSCILLTGLSTAQIFPRRSPADTYPQRQPQVAGGPSVTNFGTIDFPGTSDSAAFGINKHGQIVGGYGPNLEVNLSDAGFVLSHGSFKSIRFPGAAFTLPETINSHGEIVGSYIDSAGNYHGFTELKGTYASIDFPGAVITEATGINDSGEIVGLYYDARLNSFGFSLVGGVYSSFQAPGATFTFAQAVNNTGEIVGTYEDSALNYHGFSLTGKTFTTIDYPGAVYSAILSINNKGEMVGMYGDGLANQYEGFEHGFALIGGQYLSVDVPFVGAGATRIDGINDSDQIVGFYIDTAMRFYGYTAEIVK